jgi:MerR family transcriptional regulator, light-induced transcriptional regulator
VGCPPGEWHTFTPLLLSLFLRRRGLNVIYLGANVPSEQFAETITTVKADLIILIAQTLISAAALQNTAKSLSNQRVPVSFGGRIFKQEQALIDYLQGHYLGDAIDTSLEQVEKLLKSRGKAQEAKTPAQEYASALHAFRAARLQIENELKSLMPPTLNFTDEVNTGTQLLGDNIIAALQFGNMEHVSGEMEWLKTLLQAHQRPPQELEHFIKNYTFAVNKHMNAEGTPIKAWLNAQAKKLQT